jgi:uncharacterized protein (TIGR02145 family)
MKTLRINWLIITFILGMISFSACTKVDRVNPYDDKANLSPDEWAPQNLTIEDISITKNKLSWTYDDKNIEGFKIERRIGSGAWDSPFPLINKDLETFTDTTVIPDTSFNYEYRLYAIAGNNESAQLSVSSKAVFPAPSDLKIVINNESTATLIWTDNTNGEEGFRVEKKTNNENWQLLTTVDKNIISYQDNSFYLNTTVNYRVTSYFGQFKSAATEIYITVPTISTSEFLNITTITANCGGTISGIDIPEILDKGVCYGITQNPTIEGAYSSDGTGSGSFLVLLSPLSQNTLYYYKAYATTIIGTFYGEEKSFQTLPITLPILTTSSITGIMQTTAISGGTVTYDGGSPIIAKGVCWDTSMNPMISDNHTNDGNETGNYISNLTNLMSNTLYYVRSFATNSLGTSYGEEITFTTLSYSTPIITTNPISDLTTNSVICGGNVIDDGGYFVTERGVCWSTNENPDISGSHVNSGTGIGTFDINISGLINNTLYYLRAYATNLLGTSYGENVTFTTGTVTDVDGNVYTIILIGSQYWMGENLKVTHFSNGETIPLIVDNGQWSIQTDGAYCWYNNDEVTYGNTYGALYNWFTVDNRNLCPSGWHIPSDNEWSKLSSYLNGESFAGGKMKETGTIHWNSPNTDATNESGFTALPGGYRASNGASFCNHGDNGTWWSSTEDNANFAFSRHLYYNNSYLSSYSYYKEFGFSVRCVKD